MKKLQSLALIPMIASLALVGCSETKSDSPSSEAQETQNEPVAPESISFEWQSAYENQLNAFKGSEEFNSDQTNGSAFDLIDITGDSTPELIISPSTDKQSSCKIYTYSAGNITELGKAGFWGEFEYLPEHGLIHERYQGDGFILGKYKNFIDGAFSDFLTYSDNSGSASSGASITHEINGQEVLLSDYDDALAQYAGAFAYKIGRKYTFGDAALKYGIKKSQSWGAVLDSNKKELCRKKLTEILSAMDTDISDPAFELCDLNGDNIPEIIVSDGSAPEAQCSIYYFNGTDISSLDGKYGAAGRLKFDIENLVFYSETPTEKTYWSLADSNFSAANYTSSGSIMETGRKYELTEENITAALL